MKLLLQAGIHLIKKVITFVIYGRSVQVFKACTLFYFFSAEFFFSQIFLREKGFVPQISQIYTDFLWNLRRIALSNLRGYLQRPNRSHRRKSVSNRLCRKPPNKFRVIR